MTGFKVLAVALFAGGLMMLSAPKAPAQISVQFGAAPDCPYGYYDAAPYDCAPYGYYGPEWFNGGIFIGSGPWFHGGEGFRGRVNNRYHPDHGFMGARPQRGEARASGNRVDHVAHFRGNETRNGRGIAPKGRR